MRALTSRSSEITAPVHFSPTSKGRFAKRIANLHSGCISPTLIKDRVLFTDCHFNTSASHGIGDEGSLPGTPGSWLRNETACVQGDLPKSLSMYGCGLLAAGGVRSPEISWERKSVIFIADRHIPNVYGQHI